MKKITIPVSNPDNLRIDKYIAENADDISRSYAATLCEEKKVTVGGRPVDKKYQPKDGEVIEIDLPKPQGLELLPENIPLDIIYEDEDVIVVNKPQGMVVHPANGNESGTLVNALLFHCGENLSAINGVIRPGIVHRIDKDTAGLLIVAKNNDAHNSLQEQLKERKASRRYYALVNGTVKEGGTVNKPIGRHPKDRKKMAIVQGGREAVTHYRVLESFLGYTLLECILETGRTHQIRVHMSSLGHSLVGDRTYGIAKEKIKTEGQLLFAKTIGFNHPKTKEYMEFTAELPSYFEEILEKLRRSNQRG
ncbi:MAG: RluA family pseudouridine synthase [Clostridia bacterium]|nr:RluA family pseudouridine synthase [Clostridia bacterium]